MKNKLNNQSKMECPKHGLQSPTFICKHLQYGEGIGFHQPQEKFDPEFPFEQAWCDECNQVYLQEGEWNDKSESFAGIIAICKGCFEEIKKRNL